MITSTATYLAAPLDLSPLYQTGLTGASMNNNNNTLRMLYYLFCQYDYRVTQTSIFPLRSLAGKAC